MHIGDNMNKTTIIILLISSVAFSNCNIKNNNPQNNSAEEKITVERTIDELTSEFTINQINIDKFYRGKNIKVSGICLYYSYRIEPKPPGEQYVASIGIGNYRQEDSVIGLDEYILNNFSIICHFTEFITPRIMGGENVIILGEYNDFLNTSSTKLMFLVNCILVSVENREMETEESEGETQR